MQDIILKGTSVKREIITFLISFIVAFGINLYAIIEYKTPWAELITSLGFVAILAVCFYLIVAIVRLITIWIKMGVKSFK
ncbi:hypothetical protein [Labilibacter marinus]|uniref:hypothetical protein n=1 Tax=Labilibacter marinus TaxID=1477105 RepID=UPI0008306F58|nr:hypothetical protein [Labilibacter marinus]